MSWRVLHGDVLDVAAELEPGSVRCVVTSPPYAEQRPQYGSVAPEDYPAWTVGWLDAIAPALTADATVFVNVRPHIVDGQLADYLLHTRLAVRSAGWRELDEFVWWKRNAPPLGDIRRPRRAWESVLWFTRSAAPFCDVLANGTATTRAGLTGGAVWRKDGRRAAAEDEEVADLALARQTNVLDVPLVLENDAGSRHPARYPLALPLSLIRLGTESGDLVLDPFTGSGTTGQAALLAERRFVGVELSAEYVALAERQIGKTANMVEHGYGDLLLSGAARPRLSR